jgi:hypothetical protein
MIPGYVNKIFFAESAVGQYRLPAELHRWQDPRSDLPELDSIRLACRPRPKLLTSVV